MIYDMDDMFGIRYLFICIISLHPTLLVFMVGCCLPTEYLVGNTHAA
jgi:hypothetical protein